MDETKRSPHETEWAENIQNDLSNKGLSRRLLLDRLKVAGVGFGAAVALGTTGTTARAATLGSTNKALDEIVNEGKMPNETGISPDMSNYFFFRRFRYPRFFRRFFRRFYRRFFF